MTFCAVLVAAAFYGVNFNPAATNAATESRIYPISPVAYRMVQPDGQARLFELTDARRGILTGVRPWLGVAVSNRVDVWADPEYTGGKLRTAFTFIGGRLRLMVLDGKNYTFPRAGTPKNDLDTLFPARRKRSFAKNSAADIWRRRGRLRLWFANPNSAGALLAQLALVLTWFALRGWHRSARIAAGAFLLPVVYGLFATGSRGAWVGFVLGALAFAAVYGRRLVTKRGLLMVGIGILVLCAGVAVSGNAGRVVGTFRGVDQANALRLKVGKAAVMMFADAPGGWRGGEVPGRDACLNWYVFDEARSLRTHVMSLAECGWFKGFLYLVFWCLVLSLGVVLTGKGQPLVAAVWTAFGVAGCFNPVYVDWEVWLLPVAALGVSFLSCDRLPMRVWRRAAFAASAAALALVVALVSVGKALERPVKTSVKACRAATFVNGDDPRVWIVGDPLVMAGNGFPGREILAHYARHPTASALAYVHSVEDLPKEAACVVVAGRNVVDYLEAFAAGRACRARRLMLLSPSVGPDAVPAKLREESQVTWVVGSLLAAHDASYAERRPWVKRVSGCERYIPSWLPLAFSMGNY